MQITSSGNGHTVIYNMKLDLLNKLNLLNNFGFQEFDMRDAIIFHLLKYKKFTSRRIWSQYEVSNSFRLSWLTHTVWIKRVAGGMGPS